MEQNTEKGQKRLKGTVLFTVVAVMMVMVVFLMSTLILATASHKRAYYTYYEKQAQYAAQAALDAITNSAYVDHAFSDWVKQNVSSPGAKETITVNFGDKSQIGITDGYDNKVQCEIECIGSTPIWDEETGKLWDQMTWKITATAHVGNGVNERTESVTNYMHSTPNKKTAQQELSSTNKSENTGVGVIHEDQRTDPEDEERPPASSSVSPGIFSGSASSSSKGGNNWVLGPIYAGMNVFPKTGADITYTDPAIDIPNNGDAVGDYVYNASIRSTPARNFYFQKKSEGMVVYGNAQFDNETSITSDIPQTGPLAPTRYQELNYIYVDGNLVDGKNLYIGRTTQNQGTPLPLNVFAGSYSSLQNGTNLYGDMYLFNSNKDSTTGSASNPSNLYRFILRNVTKTDGVVNTNTGNLASDNKKLTVKNQTIGGDLLFSNPDGTLEIAASNAGGQGLTVDGVIACAGTLSFTSWANITVRGGLYVDPTKISFAQPVNVNINGVELRSDMAPDQILAALNAINGPDKISYAGLDGETAIANSPTSVQINALNMTSPITGADYTETVYNLLTNQNNAIPGYGPNSIAHVLYPFIGRNDEIFEEYIRWDLKYESKEAAVDALGTLDDTDPMIRDSVAAGHAWTPRQYTDGESNVVWTLTTNPRDTRNIIIHNIKKLPFNAHLTRGYHYYDDINAVPGKPGAGDVLNVENASTNKRDVAIAGHDSQGNFQNTAVLSNAIVITESVTIDCATFDANHRGQFGDRYVFFIDATPKNKIVVELKGQISEPTGFTFIVNNTANYGAVYDEVNEGQLYSGIPQFYDRNDVTIFLHSDLCQGGSPYLSVLTTGAYYQVKGEKLNIISNPLYPGQEGYDALPKEDKYAFELIPNVRIFGDADSTFSFSANGSNNAFFNAEIIMPSCTVNIPTTHAGVSVTYREDSDCNRYTANNNGFTALTVLGSITVKEYECKDALGLNAYLGDEHNPGKTNPPPEFTPGYEETNGEGGKASAGDLEGESFFENQYQGAG